MMNENYENNMELDETMEMTEECENSGSGKAIGLALAGLAGIVTVGTVTYKKVKAKKTDKVDKPKKKFHIGWVTVDEEKPEVVDGEIVSEEDVEE